MTDEIRHHFKAVAVPGVPLLVYAIGTYTACALHPSIPSKIQLALFAPIMALMGWCWDVLIRLSEETAQNKAEPMAPYRVLRWGIWLESGSIGITFLLAGFGLPLLYAFVGLTIAIVGCGTAIVGAVCAAPAEIRIWRASRRAKAGDK